MLPLHHDPGQDTSCRGLRLVQVIIRVLVGSSFRESGRPDSNRRSQAPGACGLARLSHALNVLASSPCGNRTHLSALKGRYPRPIDERAIKWAGGARIPVCRASTGRWTVSATSPSNEKARCFRHTGPETPREGCPWPGVTSARDRARAGSPVDRRIASLPNNPGCDAYSRRTWATSVQSMSQADSTGDRAHRLARCLSPLQTRHPGGMFARFRGDSRIVSPAALLMETDRTIRDREAHRPASVRTRP